MNGQTEKYEEPSLPSSTSEQPKQSDSASNESVQSGSHSYTLKDLAYTRSGDKGDTVNIGKHLQIYEQRMKYLRCIIYETARN